MDHSTKPPTFGTAELPKTKPCSLDRVSLLADQAGAVYVEYTILLVTVSLIGAVTSVAMGLPLLQTFHYAQLMLALPVP